MKKEYKHGEELRKFWRDQKRKYRAKKKELKLWLKTTEGQTLPEGPYETEEVQTEELDEGEL